MVRERSTQETSVIIASGESAERTLLEGWARGDHHRPVLCASAAEVLDRVHCSSSRSNVRLVVLAEPLRTQNAISLCSRISARAAAPILCIRAPGTPTTALFEAGADDIVSRPYQLEELVARARRLLRAVPAAAQGDLRCGSISVDLGARRVQVAGKPISVTPIELDLLIYLLENRDRVVTKAAIVANVLRVHGSPENARTHICHLREKLGVEGRGLINTVRREGYMACDVVTPGHDAGFLTG